MINNHQFITYEDIDYWKSYSNDEIKKRMEDPIINIHKLSRLPKGDMDKLLMEFREEGFTKYIRCGNWRSGYTKVLNFDGKMKKMKTYKCAFRYKNKWNQKSRPITYRIILNDNLEIIWIGFLFKNLDKRIYDLPDYMIKDNYFISYNNKIYLFYYEHKTLNLLPSLFSTDYFFDMENIINNDRLIIELNKREFQDNEEGIISIDLKEYFERGFFYKGPRWNWKWHEKYYPKDITRLIKFTTKDNCFFLEIENITYPFRGWCLFDLKSKNIVEAKKGIYGEK